MADFSFLDPIPKTSVAVKLPSRGVLYPKGSAMASGSLTLTPMTMIDEAIFYTPKADVNPIDKILRRCISESLEVNTLLSSDKFFLFLMLRAITYGSDYAFGWTCQAMADRRNLCGHKNTTTVRIPDDFNMKYLDDTDQEPFKIRLPECQREISFRLLRGYDEPEIEKWAKGIEMQRAQGIIVEDTTPAYRLYRQLVAVDGKAIKDAPENKVLGFILSLPPGDVQYLKDQINFFTPGINTDVTFVCSKCGAVEKGDLPVTADFFRVINQEPEGSVGNEVRPDVLPEAEPQGDDGDGPSGADVPPREAEASEGDGSGSGEDKTRRHAPRRHSRVRAKRRK